MTQEHARDVIRRILLPYFERTGQMSKVNMLRHCKDEVLVAYAKGLITAMEKCNEILEEEII